MQFRRRKALKEWSTEDQTDDDWKEARNHAIALLEASNLFRCRAVLLQNPGRNPRTLVSRRARRNQSAHGCRPRELGEPCARLIRLTKLLLDAIDKKDADQMLDLGAQLDQACEKCHMHYWYPHQFGPHPNGLPPGEAASPKHEFSDRSQRRRDAETRDQTPGSAARKK